MRNEGGAQSSVKGGKLEKVNVGRVEFGASDISRPFRRRLNRIWTREQSECTDKPKEAAKLCVCVGANLVAVDVFLCIYVYRRLTSHIRLVD